MMGSNGLIGTALVTPADPDEPGTRPAVVADGKRFELDGKSRRDLDARATAALAAAHVVGFDLDALLDLPATFVGRVVDDLARGLSAHRRDALDDLLGAVLALEPGTDALTCSSWATPAVRVAAELVANRNEAGAYARRIVARVKELGGVEGYDTVPKVRNRITSAAKSLARQSLGKEIFQGPPPPTEHPAFGHPNPTAYLTTCHAADVWHDGAGGAYFDRPALPPADPDRDAAEPPTRVRIGSREWEYWLRRTWLRANLAAVKAEDLSTATATMTAVATGGPEHPTCRRVARHGDAVYVDLGGTAWDAVRITAGGWDVVRMGDCPVKFVRHPDHAELPAAERGGTVDSLRPFVNLDGAGFRGFVSGLLDALKGRGPYLVVSVNGEKGSAKSSLCRAAVRLLDPRRTRPGENSDLARPPRNPKDLAVVASSRFLLAVDNVSRVGEEMSDLLCTVATGGAHEARTLFTDGDVSIARYCAPVWANGISTFVRRDDLADRTVFLRAGRIAERRAESDLWAAFDAARPKLLGALYDAVARGLASEAAGTPPPSPLPRMADSAAWVGRCFGHFGWDYAEWYAHLTEGIADAEAENLDDCLAACLLRTWWAELRHYPPAAENHTPQALFGTLRGRCPVSDLRHFPKSAAAMKADIVRAAGALRAAGVDVTHQRVKEKGVTRREYRIATTPGFIEAQVGAENAGDGSD